MMRKKNEPGIRGFFPHHPVRGASERDRFVNAAATPPRRGGERGRSFAPVWGGIILGLLLPALALTADAHQGQVKFGEVPVPGVTVTATQGDKKVVVVTDREGKYALPDLSDGMWTIQIEMLGFSTIKQDVPVNNGTSAPPTDWALTMLALEEMRAEVAKTPPPEPAPAPAASSARPTAAAAAAAPARPQAGFQRTQVNASGNAAPLSQSGNETPATGAFANLSPEELNQRAADGLLINGSVNNAAASPFAQLAAFGNNRRGRPLYTGAFNLQMDNSALNARSYSLTGQNTPKPDYNRFLGSFSFGGPLKIPGLLRNNGPNFFFGYSRTQNRNANTISTRMPTSAERSGDFSETRTPLGQPVQIIDPLNGAPFADNVISQNRITPQASALLNFYPLPNFEGGSRYNYQIPIVDITHQDSVQSRMNKAWGAKYQMSGNRNQFGPELYLSSGFTVRRNLPLPIQPAGQPDDSFFCESAKRIRRCRNHRQQPGRTLLGAAETRVLRRNRGALRCAVFVQPESKQFVWV
ncbi:MAG: carboxypeptidase regulatory-like domain-containing protein [Acidobacteria bacterium]|nr:carboxypeptidase regulatory-like domain-containing protein [Acidobacteriota bacterium]